MYQIRNSLPIIIMPFWDNNEEVRPAIPGDDGSACMFRLDGVSVSSAGLNSVVNGVNHTMWERKTVELLQRLGRQWKNGRYEDLTGVKWYSDVISTDPQLRLGIVAHQFNLVSGKEMDCSKQACNHLNASFDNVRDDFERRAFLFEGAFENERKSVYDWETLFSNAVVAKVLLRWMLVVIILQRGYFLGVSNSQNIDISSLANSYHFNILPVLLLPRMNMALVAFWTSGCQFEGQQRAFSEAWFLIYPALAEAVLCYYSLLNTFRKLARLRTSDKLFGATLLLLCLLHWSRKSLANPGWFDADDLISAAFYSGELQILTLVRLVTTNVAFQINENVKSVFFAKVAILAVTSLGPVVFGKRQGSAAKLPDGSK